MIKRALRACQGQFYDLNTAPRRQAQALTSKTPEGTIIHNSDPLALHVEVKCSSCLPLIVVLLVPAEAGQRDRLGKGHVPEIKPLSGVLAKLQERIDVAKQR